MQSLNKFICLFFIGILLPLPAFSSELPVPTLGSITAQRAYLESLKLQVAIKEEEKKSNELSQPLTLLPPQNLIEALKVPSGSTSVPSASSSNSNSSSSGRLISIQGVDEKQLTAKIRTGSTIVTVTQGQPFEGGIVHITKENVHIQKGNTSTQLTWD